MLSSLVTVLRQSTRRAAWIGLLFASSVCAGQPTTDAPPEQAPAASSADRDEFILGNIVFVLLHELGHAVIRDFQVPILGLEENSADTLAALTLIRNERRSTGVQAAYAFSNLLGMAAVGNTLTWRSGVEREHRELIYWAQHDLSARRGARIVCLLLGSDPDRFGWLIEAVEMPEIRAANCADEYTQAAQATAWVAQTYGRMRAGQGTDSQREIRIEYFDTRTAVQARLVSRLREAQVIEKLTAYYDAVFRFPQPLTVRLVSCGTPNAYWDADLRQLRFCYELLDTLHQLSADPSIAKAYAAFRRHATIDPNNKAGISPPGEAP